jgi:hypothetical protein
MDILTNAFTFRLGCPEPLVRERLQRAILPSHWQGKGVIGEVRENRFHLLYRGPFINSPFGPRLNGHLREEGDGCIILCHFGFRPSYWLLLAWVVWLGIFTLEALFQMNGAHLIFSTPMSPSMMASCFLVFLFTMGWLIVEHRMARQKLLGFLERTTAEWKRDPDQPCFFHGVP